MKAQKKKPLECLAAEREAGDGRYVGQNTAFPYQSQAHSPISWLIRSSFIENLVSRPFTAERSLRVDCLLICTEFIEERCSHGWN